MKPFDFVAPDTLDAAIALFAEHGDGARPLAGGTDMLVDLKHVPKAPKVVVSLANIGDFKGIEMTDGGLRIGSTVTHTEIMEHPLIAEHAPAMIDAARTVGAVQTRNLGTLGGNLVTCVPSMDSGPVVVALEAEVTVAGSKGSRTMPITEFFVGPRKTALETGELLVSITLPKSSLGKAAAFRKFGLRKGQALALVNCAAAVNVVDGKLSDVRIALGAVAPVVMRAMKAEESLNGADAKRGDIADLLREAGRIAASEARPIDDFRASADYRRDLIRVGTFRVLEEALNNALNT